MKKLSWRTLAATFAIALAGTLFAGITWIAATTQGTFWLLTTAAALTDIGFTVEKREGRLLDHLLLSGVRLRMAPLTVAIDRLELRWEPYLLLAGTVALQKLTLSGVRIQDDSPADNKAPVLAWPKLPESAHLLDGRIELLQVSDLSYRRQLELPVQVANFNSSVIWQDSVLSINQLSAGSPYGQINGSVSAGFKQPSLTADLRVALPKPLAEMDTFTLKAARSSAVSPEQLAGSIAVTGMAGKQLMMELSGEVGMARDAFKLRGIRLTRPGRMGVITADGTLGLATLEAVLSLQVKASGLNLSPELNVPTDISGSLLFAGTLKSYKGNFTLANTSQGWQAAALSAAYQGTGEGLKLTQLTGSILDGSLSGNLDINWQNGFNLQGELNGSALNPGRIAPDWKGVVNFNASGNMGWSAKAPMTGSIKGALLESRLHGRELTGDLLLDFSGSNISLSRLALQGKGFDLHASGDLQQRLTVAAQISDLSRLVPGSAGKLQAEGWVRRRDRQFSGSCSATGSNLAYAGARISTARVAARLDEGTGFPLHATASLRNVVYKGYSLNSVTLATDGTLLSHNLNAALRSAGAEAELAITAAYNEGLWKGEITRLAGKDSSGPWRLANAAGFEVSAGKILLSPLSLTAGPGERLEIAIDLSMNPLSGQVRAELTQIDLARLKPWLAGDTRLEGHISGRAKGIMLAGQRFEVDGTAEINEGKVHRKISGRELDLAFTSTASCSWRGEALTGSLFLKMADHGQARTDFRLPIAARYPVVVDPQGTLQASLLGQFHDKGSISTMLPEFVQESFGELDADVVVKGTWQAPQIGGTLQLSKGGAYLPTVGIHLREARIAAHLEKDLIRIDSFRALSGAGHIEGTALVKIAGFRMLSYEGTIRGENFQTYYFPELQILSSPGLSFEGTAENLSLRGELLLPEMLFIGAQSPKAVGTSSDVIREGKIVTPTKRSPMVLDVKVRTVLGERVFVKVAGINAQLGGTLDLSLSTLDRITSKGEIKVIKGHYRTYGVDLEIVRGRLFFAGGPINSPSLDVLALRTIGSVRAGVTVTGTLQKPVTKLYSEPAMPDVDVLAYIVLGHPLGSNTQQASLVAQAAGAVLTSGQAETMQEQIKKQLGLSTLEIQGGVGGSTSHMGYKPLQVTPPGAIPASQLPGNTDTVLTVGKYLTPQIYVSYGKSIFTGSNLFLLRYDIFKKWQIETQTGSESGIDLFYKFEFK